MPTIRYEHIATLKGHQSMIVDLSWSSSDLKILSAGLNGTVYQFPMVIMSQKYQQLQEQQQQQQQQKQHPHKKQGSLSVSSKYDSLIGDASSNMMKLGNRYVSRKHCTFPFPNVESRHVIAKVSFPLESGRDPTGEFVRKGVTIYCATFVDNDEGFVCYGSDGILRQVLITKVPTLHQ